MGKWHFFMGKSTISMAIFNSFLYVYQRVCFFPHVFLRWARPMSNQTSLAPGENEEQKLVFWQKHPCNGVFTYDQWLFEHLAEAFDAHGMSAAGVKPHIFIKSESRATTCWGSLARNPEWVGSPQPKVGQVWVTLWLFNMAMENGP